MGDFQLLISKNQLSTILARWQLIGVCLVFLQFRGETFSLLNVCWCVSQFDAILNLSLIAVNFCS